jgi:N6-adenosine-specific RNA methylase IME4
MPSRERPIKYSADDEKGQLKQAIAVHLVDNCEPLPSGEFDIITADPPWFYSLRESDKTHRNRCQYPPMKTEAIAAMPVGELGMKDSYCFLWATAGHLQDAFKVMGAWGYTYKAIHCWRKVTKDGRKVRIGAGHYGRNCLEFILIGLKGKPGSFLHHGLTAMPNVFDGIDCQADGYILPDRAMDFLDFTAAIEWTGADYIFDAPPTQTHSEKPQIYYDRINEIRRIIYPNGGNCIELFAREKRKGWTVWGAESDQRIEIVR